MRPPDACLLEMLRRVVKLKHDVFVDDDDYVKPYEIDVPTAYLCVSFLRQLGLLRSARLIRRAPPLSRQPRPPSP